MSTFQELQNSVTNYFGSTSSEYTTEVQRAINEAIWEIDSENPEAPHLQGNATPTTTVGTIAVTSGIPTDYDHTMNMYLIDPDDSKARYPLKFLSRKLWNEERLFDAGNSKPTHYSIWDGSLYVGPPPDKAYTLNHDYYAFNTELTTGAQTTKLTDHYERWEHVILLGAIAKIHSYQRTDEQMVQKSLLEYENAKSRFRAWVRRNEDKAPESSRMRGWKERNLEKNPFLDTLAHQY